LVDFNDIYKTLNYFKINYSTSVNMDFNLTKLLAAVNSKFSHPKSGAVEFNLTEDNMILAYMGNVAYFFDYKKLQEVLDINVFDEYRKEETQSLINELLSKHIINQLRAASGRKIYPEIKTHPSDLNTHD